MNPSSFAAFRTVFRKELHDFVRDRRTFLMALLLGPLVYPLLMLGMGKLMETRVSTQLEKSLEVPIVGAQYAPNLIEFLGTLDIHAKTPPKDLVAAIRSQDEDVALVIAPDFAEQWRAGKPAKVEIVADSTRTNADVPVQRLRAALEGYSRQVGALRLVARGVSQQVKVAQLYRQYGGVIYSRCRRLLKDDSLAEDATQEVFVRVQRHIESAPDDTAALAWIYRISTNFCLNLIRDRSKQAEPTDELPEAPSEHPEIGLVDRQLAMKLIERVPEQLRAPAVLYFLDGMEQEQIAESLQISRRTVINRLQEFAERSRKFMAREPEGGLAS